MCCGMEMKATLFPYSKDGGNRMLLPRRMLIRGKRVILGGKWVGKDSNGVPEHKPGWSCVCVCGCTEEEEKATASLLSCENTSNFIDCAIARVASERGLGWN